MARKWWSEGLPFKCTQCGDCCRIEGYVWVTSEDIERLASFLKMSATAFEGKYVRQVGRKRSLIEKPNSECIFWEDGCSVYPVRPPQCKTFPFWHDNLSSLASWQQVVEECPGSGTGVIYSADEIKDLLRGRGETNKEGDFDG